MNPGTRHRKLPEELKPVRLMSDVYYMPHTAEASTYLKDAIEYRKESIRVYVVGEPFTFSEFIEHARSLPTAPW